MSDKSMIDAMRELYQAGVDCGLESFQGAEVIAWVVDAGNRRVEKAFPLSQLEAVPDWLLSEAVSRHYSEAAGAPDRTPHELLAELAEGRKSARRVSSEERRERFAQQLSQESRSA